MLWLSSCVGLSAPLTAFVLHVLCYRLWPSAHRVPRQKLALMLVFVTVLGNAVAVIAFTRDGQEALNAAVVSLMFGYSYFHWFNMSETARRIRILVLYVAHGAASVQTSTNNYSGAMIFENRLQRLTENGTISLVDGRYQVNAGPLLWAARVILFWRSLFY